ncbi:AAA family ATPase [Corynebacterium auriscanis]|uniref:AAA family ATPase n=1 Tax=Corynebacterium auriscanis TaxID=99807 RepID=UPI0022474C10|nr:AAA family ATPase [Corynebacterium auriscanis]MCX2162449.1 AAA family ATPase [Corynebacterium auriscanis]
MTATTSKNTGWHRQPGLAPALQIRRLEVRNFAGVEHAKIEPQTPGVTVIHGPNESGKSTFVAAFQLLLNPKYRRSTADKNVTKFKTRGKDLAFVVEADLRLGDYELTIRKEFKERGGQSILTITKPRLENFSGNEAEDRFHELLAEKVDLGLRQALTVNQGDDLGNLVPADVTSLSGAMAKEATTEVDGVEASAQASGLFADDFDERIYAAVREEYDKYFTKTGRATKQIKDLEDKAQQAYTEQIDAEQRLTKAQDVITALESARRERKKVRLDQPGAEAAVEKAVDNLKKAESRDAQLKQAQSRVEVATLHHDNLQATVDKRRELIDEHAKTSSKVQKLTQAHQQAMEAAREEEANLSAVLAKVSRARARLDSVRGWTDVAEAVQNALEFSCRLATEQRLIAELGELEKQKQKESDLLAKAMKPKAGQMVRDAVATYRAELRVLESVSTQVQVSGPKGLTFVEADREIQLDGKQYTTNLTTSRAFTFGEFAVEVHPHDDRSDAQESVARALTKLKTAVTKAGLRLDLPKETPTDRQGVSAALDNLLQQVDAKDSEREDSEARLRSVEAAIATKTAGRSSAEVQTSIASLLSSVDATRSEAQEYFQVAKATESDEHVEFSGRDVLERFVESASVEHRDTDTDNAVADDADTDKAVADNADTDNAVAENAEGAENIDQELSGAAAALAALKKLQSQAESAVHEVQNQREELAGTPYAIAVERAKSELDVYTERMEAVAEQLENQREKVGDDDVASAMQEAKDAVRQAKNAEQELRESFQGTDSVEDAQLKLESANTTKNNLELRERKLSEDIVAFSTELNNSATARDDAVDAAIAAEKAAAELAEMERKAAAAKLLMEELTAAREEKQAKYQAPFKEQFEALARYTFGFESEFDFDQGLRVATRMRGGLALERELLSGGAQEQIGLLTRLTVATLVGQGGGVPIILDDVLGFTDDNRAEGMRSALSTVGRDHQIIVFTCAPERFQGVASAKVLSMSEAKRDGGES